MPVVSGGKGPPRLDRWLQIHHCDHRASTQIALQGGSANSAVAGVPGSGTIGMTVIGQTAARNITGHRGDVTFTSGTMGIKRLSFPRRTGGLSTVLSRIPK